ncbi:Hsp70 family protein [Actinoplanes friuliensis]|uniref:Heat shock protein 70 n=1 Tax=Actinoplanes friuliensis DSM 7358 TaxID=1246995 RepID=U5WBU8_9ACTN|nr:Hsp70 family protein [Actinoplanes friuliensis]AGZ46472.1 heat shock protein 70 [Actinoplanes friuliensis DSM 7358]
MTDGYVLGVDLGTSHTVAMLRWPDGRTRPLLFDGQPLLPSAVYLDTTGRLHVGRDALRLGQAEPDRFEPNPKRHIDAETVLLGGSDVPTADLLAALLGAVAREAVAATGFLPPAVLTYPAAWGSRRREVLTTALARAGWPPSTRLVAEPVSAARYFADVLRRPVPVGSALAVFDFGGGTLDIAVVRNEGVTPEGLPTFAVAASGGVDDLGGLDLDAALVDHLGATLEKAEPAAWAALTEPVTLAQWRARRQFWDDVRGAKEMLSRTPQAPVPVPGVERAVHLTRDEFETAAGPLLRRGVEEAGAVITAAGLQPADLAGLFLVGGSSRVPLVARLLHSELGIAPTVLEQPELPVAEGSIIAGSAPATDAGETPAQPLRAAAVPPTTVTMAHGGPTATAATNGTAPTSGRPVKTEAQPVAVNAAPASAAPAPAPPAAPAGQAQVGESDYAEPVDPWATGEAAAFGNGGGPVLHPVSGAPVSGSPVSAPPPAEPWLASTHEEANANTRVKAYRRKGLWVVAAATVVVLGAAATATVLLWPGYPALDYQALSEEHRVAPAVPVTSAFSGTAVRDKKAYFASADDNGTLGVVAADTESGKKAWSSTDAGAATRWEFFFALPDAVVAISDTDSGTSTRRMVLLDPDDGKKMWDRTVASADNVLFAGDKVVLVDRTENRLVGLEIGEQGKVGWELKSPKSEYGLGTTQVVAATTEDDLTGPATATGLPFAEVFDDDARVVQIGADRSARVVDASTGKVVAGPRQNVGEPDDPIVAHNGRLIVAESGDSHRVVAYDLAKLAETRVVYTAPKSDTQFGHLTACGADRICFAERTGYDAKTAQVVAVDAAKEGELWRRAVPEVDSLVPVGEAVLATRNSSPVQTTLLDAKGKVSWTRGGVIARIDGGNTLQFSKALSTSADDPGLAGEHLGDKAVPLGSLADVRSSTCSWDTTHLACVADEDFVIQRFAG